MTTSSPYTSVAVYADVHWKLEQWRRALSDRWDKRATMNETVDWLLDNMGPPNKKGERMLVELVVYDPKDEDTYPSVCVFPEEVAQRFGFTGGEKLLFTSHGSYIGELVKEFKE